ncbi:DUF5990 family protein [Comamonas serinivorans]|uniref:DUF5990 family protein n=1 Tax=Comamonas serinivorans TaxID=1082851 RepID=UPI003AAC5128
MKQALNLRLIVTDPLPGVQCAMQRGQSGLHPPVASSDALVFEFAVQVDLSKDPISLTGEFTQGPPAKRFVYVNSGTYAGESGTSWSRRAKVPITGIPAALAKRPSLLAKCCRHACMAVPRMAGRSARPFLCCRIGLLRAPPDNSFRPSQDVAPWVPKPAS